MLLYENSTAEFSHSLGQKAKYSERAHVFRCYSSNGHEATTPVCRLSAMYGRRPRCKKRPARAQGLASLPSNGQATFRRFGRCKSGSVWSRAVKTDLDFLLYPLATEGPPECPACGTPMVIVLHEARENNPDFSRFRCAVCKRSETFICEE